MGLVPVPRAPLALGLGAMTFLGTLSSEPSKILTWYCILPHPWRPRNQEAEQV